MRRRRDRADGRATRKLWFGYWQTNPAMNGLDEMEENDDKSDLVQSEATC